MAKPLLYKPPPRWQMWAALGGAIAIHLGAVGAYAIKHEAAPVDLSDIPTATVDATIQQVEDQPTPPPEDIPIPEAPPMPDVKPEFVEETTPPPRINRPIKAAPIKAPTQSGSMNMSTAKASAVSAPRPAYPYEARAHHITGSGICVVTVDVASGNVTEATMVQSTGNNLLDQSTTNAFRRWKFRPGSTAPKVKIPITYNLTGASY
jgi:TonB family protein